MDTQGDIARIYGPGMGPADARAATAPVAGEPSSLPSDAEARGLSRADVATPSMSALAQRVVDAMRVNYEHRRRSGVDERLRYAVMAQTCTYTERQRERLRACGVPERVFVPVTATKVRAAKSMLVELATYGADIPFAIDPTPDPDLPEEVEAEVASGFEASIARIFSGLAAAGVQSVPPDAMAALEQSVRKAADGAFEETAAEKDAWARRRAKRLERRVYDTMVEGGFNDALMTCIDDVCTYGTCVMVGPVLRNVARNASTKNRRTGVRRIRRVVESVPCYEAVSPVDCYPSPDALKVTDGTLCIRVKYTREELWRFKSASVTGRRQRCEDGWRDNAVSVLLSSFPKGCRLDEFPKDQVVREAQNDATDSSDDCRFEGIRCFAYVSGRELLGIGVTEGLDGTRIDADDYYYTETVVLGGIVVFCRIYDARIGMPLSKGVFYELSGSWWGESIADKLYATQAVMNNAVVSLLRNMGPASSAMMWINDVSRLVDKSANGLAAEPGKIYAFGSSFTGQTAAGAPMGILQVPSNAAELLAVAKWGNAQADLDSGIPAFAEGTGGSNGGALRTAEGLRTYTEAAARGMKMVVLFLDRGVIRDQAKRTADWILVYDDDMELKGDVQVQAVGLMGRLLKAQNDQARVQLLNLCLNSPLMQQILGAKGIVELFRPSCRDINVNPDKVCPSTERMDMLEQVEGIKQVLAATAAARGVDENASAAQGGGEGRGMMPGVTPVAKVGGGVSGRRGVA